MEADRSIPNFVLFSTLIFCVGRTVSSATLQAKVHPYASVSTLQWSLFVGAAVDALSKLLREGLASGAAQEGGELPAALAARIDQAKAWLARSAASMTALKVTSYMLTCPCLSVLNLGLVLACLPCSAVQTGRLPQ